MKKVWYNLNTNMMFTEEQHIQYLGYMSHELVEMNCLKIKNQYYKIGKAYPNKHIPFVQLIPLNEPKCCVVDDFDLGPQCEEYYV